MSAKEMGGSTIYQIQETVASQIKLRLSLPETGGILGVNIDAPHIITAFHYDSTGKTQGNTYTPDVDTLNRVISEWAENGIEFAGFVHSHPRRNRKLSPPDIEYANKIKDVCDMPQIIMAIYLPDSGEIFTYVL
ncbi:MAG: hypothetical protein IJP89_01190 [Synergistaceae bacterium]|nr:hypothetical protein [Synergistaceae bacterium]MBR0256639.1 hypothetical protein [Synergistaceae bacterium]